MKIAITGAGGMLGQKLAQRIAGGGLAGVTDALMADLVAPALPAGLHTPERLVRGCQSQVWIETCLQDGRLQLFVDSDAFIVKGLLAVVLAAYNNRTPAAILEFDIEQYFQQLDLLGHLSASRGNGLRAMVQRIQDTARAQSA